MNIQLSQFFLNVKRSNYLSSSFVDKISVLKRIGFHPLGTNILKTPVNDGFSILQTNHQKALINPESCHLPSWSPT